jgi:hypothetical protein
MSQARKASIIVAALAMFVGASSVASAPAKPGLFTAIAEAG